MLLWRMLKLWVLHRLPWASVSAGQGKGGSKGQQHSPSTNLCSADRQHGCQGRCSRCPGQFVMRVAVSAPDTAQLRHPASSGPCAVCSLFNFPGPSWPSISICMTVLLQSLCHHHILHTSQFAMPLLYDARPWRLFRPPEAYYPQHWMQMQVV